MTIYNRANAGAAALAVARRATGLPYVWGGEDPAHGFDCSGLTQWAWGAVGVQISRTTYGQYLEYQIPRSEPSLAGDLLFIAGSDAVGSKPGHVMMFVSHGRAFQAEGTGIPIGEFDYPTDQFAYRTRPALALPPPPVSPQPPTIQPSAAFLAATGLVRLPSVAAAHLADQNHWTRFYYGVDGGFHPISQFPSLPVGTTQYANHAYQKPRP